jgi:2-dehydropantoate 2-reductase
VGGYYGGRIAEAFQKDTSGKKEIYFIARGEHLKAIQQKGILVKTPDRVYQGVPTGSTDNINEVPPPDLILLCTKSYDLKGAVTAIKTRVKEDTVIIPLLNGVDIYDRIRAEVKSGFVLPACIYLGTHIESPGVISQSGGNGIILSGPDPGFPQFDAGKVRQFFQETGIGFEWNESAYPSIWEKYIFIAAFGLVTAYSGKTLGEVMENEDLAHSVEGIIQEIVAIAEKKAVKLPGDICEKSLKKAYNFPFDAKTSYQRDIEAWPKPNEGDLYGGAILRAGAALGVPTPMTEKIYSKILLNTSK